MSYSGSGVITIWHDIAIDRQEDFYEWHNREHVPERIAIDGFLRGRRYISIEGEPLFFNLYNVRDRAVLASPAYLSRLNSPTDWTRKANTYFSNESRSLCEVLYSAGVGCGGVVGTIRFDCDPSGDSAVERELRGSLLPAIGARPGVVGTHLCRADVEISKVRTAEHQGRVDNMVPRWVVLVEACQPDAVRAVLQGPLSAAKLSGLGVPAAAHGIYQLQYDLISSGKPE